VDRTYDIGIEADSTEDIAGVFYRKKEELNQVITLFSPILTTPTFRINYSYYEDFVSDLNDLFSMENMTDLTVETNNKLAEYSNYDIILTANIDGSENYAMPVEPIYTLGLLTSPGSLLGGSFIIGTYEGIDMVNGSPYFI
jgi:hypothetical protein